MDNAIKDTSYNYYENNRFVHCDRALKGCGSDWVSQFDCAHIRPLVICRGPVRKEAMDVFSDMGMTQYGILLSDKDSIQFAGVKAPELRLMRHHDRIHHVKDYTAITKKGRLDLIEQIISICVDFQYNAVFAGYGFMSEDPLLVEMLEAANLIFIGPNSKVVRKAGQKDVAKKIAEENGVSVTSGVSNLTALALLRKTASLEALQEMADPLGIVVSELNLDACEKVLHASYKSQKDLLTIDEIAKEAVQQCIKLFEDKPSVRLRLKAISGGGGKGQRIISAPGVNDPVLINEAAYAAYDAYREILNEVKVSSVGDNKNVIIEQNIESIRHQEVQLVGNGDWCISLGARDCSAQMHEQKLVEVSLTLEGLRVESKQYALEGNVRHAQRLLHEEKMLTSMEASAEAFGSAVDLDSVSTFECIVDDNKYYFMEMNTRIQVEHRVSELCYQLRFTNPDLPDDFFVVDSLIELMVILAVHGDRLPKPKREVRYHSSVEVRLNATDDALKPSAGGEIEYWSDPLLGEIRDDQGICLKNPDSGQFVRYQLAGAYDSNIALLIAVGATRKESVERLCEVLRVTTLKGVGLETNLDFLYGYLTWWLSNDVYAEVTTHWVQQYLTLVGCTAKLSATLDIDKIYEAIVSHTVQAYKALEVSNEEYQLVKDAFYSKKTLFVRPIVRLFKSPHLLVGWLLKFRYAWSFKADRVIWKINPLVLLEETYHFLNMEFCPSRPSLECLWSEDCQVLEDARAFYACCPWPISDQTIEQQETHLYYQLGTELLQLLPAIGRAVRLEEVSTKDGKLSYPQYFDCLETRQKGMTALSPPPPAGSNQIVAPIGGMFYPRPAPNEPVYLEKGSRFKVGDPLFVIEVMKMFNTVRATFSGTVEAILVDTQDAQIVTKGQVLYKVQSDTMQNDVSEESKGFSWQQWLNRVNWAIDEVWRK